MLSRVVGKMGHRRNGAVGRRLVFGSAVSLGRSQPWGRRRDRCGRCGASASGRSVSEARLRPGRGGAVRGLAARTAVGGVGGSAAAHVAAANDQVEP